jgi:hypothetical protein
MQWSRRSPNDVRDRTFGARSEILDMALLAWTFSNRRRAARPLAGFGWREWPGLVGREIWGSAFPYQHDFAGNARCAGRMEMRWLRLQARRKFFCQHRDTTPKLDLTLQFISLGVLPWMSFSGARTMRGSKISAPERLLIVSRNRCFSGSASGNRLRPHNDQGPRESRVPRPKLPR